MAHVVGMETALSIFQSQDSLEHQLGYSAF